MPLDAYRDLSAFKIYANDIGLLRRMTNLDSKIVVEGSKIFEEFKGALTENYILQMLSSLKFNPNYYAFDNRYEIDFMIQYKNEVIPIEVKSNENVNNTSLKVYNERYKPTKRVRFSMRNLQQDDNLINIPLFIAEYMEKFL